MAPLGALAQERSPGHPFPQDYNTYDDYRDFAQVSPESGQAVDADAYDASGESMSMDELNALLPDHLRAPLPMQDQPASVRPNTMRAQRAPQGPASPIESFFREATGDGTLVQFGYDFFGRSAEGAQAKATPPGTVQDDYILGPGDHVTVMFLGERKDRDIYKIGSNGALSIDLLPSIAASGKTLEQVRSDLQNLLNVQGYHGEVFVNLENIRQIAVLVAGHVTTPGRQIVTPLQTALEAIDAAGGVSKSGSLRQIRLIRGGDAIAIDLYDVIGARGKGALPPLQDGDRIMVPPLGPTIAISGDVRQPGIYELLPKRELAAADALNLAGGVLSSGKNRITLMTPQNDGQRISTAISRTSGTVLNDGAVIQVSRSIDQPAQSFTLLGEVRSPGVYPLASYRHLAKLLRSAQIFGDDVYPLLGAVSRRRASDLARDLVAFSPQDVFMGRADLKLQDGDQVYLLARKDVMRVMEKEKTDLPPLVQTFIREHGLSIQGAVRLPGNWPVAGPLPVSRILDVAGGPLTDADLSRAEILRNDVGFIEASAGAAVSRRDVVDLTDANVQAVTVTFGDALRIPDRFEAVTRQTVMVGGEVRNPGTYDLMRGDTMLTLIDRAGGLTDQAYPLGAVFSRAAERRREKEKFSAAARDLERAIAMAAETEDGKVDMQQMALAKELVDELKTIEPVGRITVEADPGILRQDPAQDILLEAGDRIYMPKRPLSVRVTGEVLSPAALQFRADKKTSDYLAEAGGTTHHADKGRMFVLFPNGSAQPLNASTWTTFKPVMITPGSTIVVPRDPKPFSFIDSAKDITQILSNLAITGIYAEDLVDRN